MGSCISKCKPKKSPNKQKPKEEECKCIDQNNPTPSILQDKLVISQASIVSPTPSKKSPISPLSPSNYTTTSSSSSSSSCSSLSTASSSASSTSLSIPSPKLDRSFSNEYLWSCVKENPQIVLPNYPIKVNVPTRTRPSLNSRRQTNHGGSVVSRQVAQKRSRCSSPTPCNDLSRQKSFRREANNRAISPSPSRRFRGEMVTTCIRRESGNIRPRSPSNNNNNVGSKRLYGRSNNLLAKRENETNVKRVEFKMEELELGKLFSGQDMDWMPLEDVNNPHIALDCFIFL